jgi:hypothetical protein
LDFRGLAVNCPDRLVATEFAKELRHHPTVAPTTICTMPNTKPVPEQPDRELRIICDVVVDAYNESERALGWYYYLQNEMRLPFKARCTSSRTTSPLKVGQEVEVVGQDGEDNCMSEVLVMVKFGKTTLSVPLAQLESLSDDADTRQAVSDWHYWVGRGYRY